MIEAKKQLIEDVEEIFTIGSIVFNINNKPNKKTIIKIVEDALDKNKQDISATRMDIMSRIFDLYYSKKEFVPENL